MSETIHLRFILLTWSEEVLTLEGRKRQLTPFDFLFSDILSSGISSNPVFSDFYFFMLTHISGKFQRSTFKNKKIRSMTT